ncbi:helix-turn-helix domain-containing protein [Thiothrix subterranea]|uniref:helix-turn-helix domain-containing protein n=1 Tax=Thiothrix subterranea TaxID=2735563 RepID=UPI00192BEF61|nr:helix-turn-helix transcriptional regulator [Thiothrix subterranea]QQZ28676.1 helix-turn-helix domain-containing protein [Thiothrix subterranea]
MARPLTPLPTPQQSGALTPELLGQFIRAKRTQSGLRIDDAAALLGVAKDTLSKLERGHHGAQLGTLLQVLNGLGIILTVEAWAEGESDDWV